MESSRIPKASFQPKFPVSSIPQVRNTVKPPPEVRPMWALRRRSKSTSDLRSLRTKPVPDLRSLQTKPVPGKAGVKSNVKPAPARTAIKRPALQKIDEENKPKVPKANKIPDWDYKSRFLDLQKKHVTLQNEIKELRPQLQRLIPVSEECQELRKEVSELRESYNTTKELADTLSEEKTKYKSDYLSTHAKYHEIKRDYDDLTETYKNIVNDYKEVADLKAGLEIKAQNLESSNFQLQQKIEEHDILQRHLRNSLGKIENEYKEVVDIKAGLEAKTHHLEDLNLRLRQKLEEQDGLRRQLHNSIQDLRGNIRVFCRVRPPLVDDKDKDLCAIFCPDESKIEIRKSRESVCSTSGRSVDFKQEFTFDRVFPPEARQQEVFEELAPLVQSALDGYNVCVFAYGQTGSGKTFTMQGSSGERGMIPLTIDLIFDAIAKSDITNWTYTVSASFLEIYNETVKDLLEPNNAYNCELRYNEGRGVTVTNLQTIPIASAKELKNFMEEAHRNRAVAATDFNEHSSRSHAVTKINLEGVNKETKMKLCGSINLVDLAGSESAKTSNSERLTETKNINKSLSTLGNVMLALHNKDSHIPYRDSKLTFLLQSCLGGNSKTLMFVNISPFEECFSESVNSLRFACKVKEIKTTAKRNKIYQ